MDASRHNAGVPRSSTSGDSVGQGLKPGLFERQLRAAVERVPGGLKKVGAQLRPDMDADDAGRWLAACLNTKKRELLHPIHYVMLWRIFRNTRVLDAINWLHFDAGLLPVDLIQVEEEFRQVTTDFGAIAQTVTSAVGRLDRLERLMAAEGRV